MCIRITNVAFLFILPVLIGCNSGVRKDWTISIPSNNSKYEQYAALMDELFVKEGLSLKVVRVPSAVEAGMLVARGEADLMLSLSHSDFLIPKLGEQASDLRTVMPLFDNAMFLFYRNNMHPRSIIELVEHSKIYLEVFDSLSEQRLGLEKVFGMLNVTDYEFVSDTAQATIMPVWGMFAGATTKMVDKQWTLYSMEESFIEYALMIEPRFRQLSLPAKYAAPAGQSVRTLVSTAFLCAGKHVDKTDLYDLVSMLFENRVFFNSHERSYSAMQENFKVTDLNFPLHAGASAFLRRNQPTFLERHAEYYGLILSVLMLLFGIAQSLRSYVAQMKKDRIDQYFLEYLAIKNNTDLDVTLRMEKLNVLFEKAVNQMIREKLDITDFDIFSQAIRSDINYFRQEVAGK